jgi:putative transposase
MSANGSPSLRATRASTASKHVSQALTEKELTAIRTSVQRGRPFGDIDWVEELADQHDLWSTLRPRGRPAKTIDVD